MEQTEKEKYSVSSDSFEAFDKEVRAWWESLSSLITKKKNEKKSLIIVALSRKMPRFIEWFKNNYSFLPDIKLLDEVEITSELAIPYLFAFDDIDDKYFILVDDILIYGDSIIKSATDINVLLNGTDNLSEGNIEFAYDIISTHEEADIFFQNEKSWGQNKINDFVDIISEAVGNDLPIDFEFPIFVTRQPVPEYALKQWIINSFSPKDSIEKTVNNRNSVKLINADKGLVCLDENSISDNATIDFFKCRFFGKEEAVAFEVFSPVVLSSYDLINRDNLFTDPTYQRLWETSTGKVRDLIRNVLTSEDIMKSMILRKDYEQSLCVWANYLFAISAYNKEIAPAVNNGELPHFALSKKELNWLLGKKLESMVWNDLETILKYGVTTDIITTKSESVPYSYSPDEFQSMMDATKTRLKLESKDPVMMLRGVFQAQHYTNPAFKRPTLKRYYFGESYRSLKDMIEPFVKDSEEEIHNWIDSKIDACGIIPKYAMVKGSDGQNYWRRFFHAGILNYDKF